MSDTLRLLLTTISMDDFHSPSVINITQYLYFSSSMTLGYTGTTLLSHYKCNWLVLTQAFFPWPNPSKRNQTATFFTALSTWRQRSCSWSSPTSHMFWFRVITAFVMSLWMTQMLRCVDVLGINRYIIEKETCNARHISPPFPPTTQSSVVGAGGGLQTDLQ